MLKGYKTYILAGVTVIGAVASYLVGDISLQAAVQLAVTAALGAALRDGINTAVKK
jgi:hypothetical protein